MTNPITVPGTPFAGGFYAGRITIDDKVYALVVAPKAEGEAEDLAWKPSETSTAGARSLHDGFANSEAMNDDGHPAAQFCRSLTIGGFTDWYLPSRSELNLLAETFMPGAGGNPEQTAAEAFKEGGPEAFDEDWYWTSTEYSAGYAWCQFFYGGGQYGVDKGWSCRVRAVRKVLI